MAIQLLDLWQSLVVEVFGSSELFFIGVLFGILILSVALRFSQRTMLLMIISTSLVLSYFINKILAVVLLLVLAGIGLAYARFVSRG